MDSISSMAVNSPASSVHDKKTMQQIIVRIKINTIKKNKDATERSPHSSITISSTPKKKKAAKPKTPTRQRAVHQSPKTRLLQRQKDIPKRTAQPKNNKKKR